MKVGIDISAVVYGTGVSDYTANLVSSLLQETRDVDFALWGFSLRRQEDIRRLFPQAKTRPLPPTLLDWLWNYFHLAPVEWLTEKVDVFHSSDWTQPPTGAKKVTTIHDLSPFLFPQELHPSIVATHTRRMKWVVRECDHIICVSENTAQDLQRLFNVPREKLSVIYEGLPARFLLKPRMTKRTNYAVAIGARQPRKNIARLISGFLKYRDKYNLPSKLVIVGEMARIYDHPSVEYTGYVSDQDLVDILAGAEVFVYPSLYEGFGLPVLGAFHHKVPVVASSASSLPEVAGNAAVLVDPLNEEDIVRGMGEAIKRRPELVKLGLEQLKKFNWKTAAQQTLEVYKHVNRN